MVTKGLSPGLVSTSVQMMTGNIVFPPPVLYDADVLCSNISETLPGTRQTNQRAELTAIQRALESVPRNRDVAIITDSRYAIDCVTTWYINWRKNGWKTSAGKAVENKDLVENVLSKIEERNRLKVQTLFEWIKGHANNPGNVAADKLAVGGARQGANLE